MNYLEKFGTIDAIRCGEIGEAEPIPALAPCARVDSPALRLPRAYVHSMRAIFILIRIGVRHACARQAVH